MTATFSIKELRELADEDILDLVETDAMYALLHIVEIVKRRRARFAHESGLTDTRNDEERLLDTLLEKFVA